MSDELPDLTRPIIGIENRSAQEAFDIMADRIRAYLAALAATPAARAAVLEQALKAIDSQVLTAARSMEKEQREQPEWVWHANDGPGRTSYGRWQKLPHQAPYIRADLVLRALKEKT